MLGPVAVVDEEGGSSPVTGRSRQLLTLLALRHGRVVRRDELIDRLWDGDPPPTAPTSLRGSILRLRDTLSPGRRPGSPSALRQSGDGWTLVLEPDQLDIERFERATTVATRSGPAVAVDVNESDVARWRDALAIWRGPALVDVRDELEEARAAAVRLDEQRLDVTSRCIAWALDHGHHATVVGELLSLVEEHPYDERFVGQLMIALQRSGRQADALAAFDALRRRLRDELGIHPCPELDAVHRVVLVGQVPHLPGAAAAASSRPHTGPCAHDHRRRGRHPRLAP